MYVVLATLTTRKNKLIIKLYLISYIYEKIIILVRILLLLLLLARYYYYNRSTSYYNSSVAG
jgi:hypothetical protein